MKNMNKITPCLWFDNQAEEASKFYTTVLNNATVKNTVPFSAETPSQKTVGSVMTVAFEIEEQPFLALNGGLMFQPNHSISFFFTCENKAIQDEIWTKLSAGGKVLMPLEKYPFSEYYGWVEDKFGVSWQLILNNPKGDWRPKIVPSLLFAKDVLGKAEEAMNFYANIFKNAKESHNINHYPAEVPGREGMLAFGDFQIAENQWLAAMDSGVDQDLSFSEGISLIVQCADQNEIDYYWEKLNADPNSGQCGWLKDKYGVSWQIVPQNMGRFTNTKQAMEAMLKMKKIIISELEQVNQ